MPRGQFANAGEKFFRMHDHPARALQQRLDDHGGDFRAALIEQRAQTVETLNAARCALLADRAAIAIRRMRAQNLQS